MKYVYPAIFTEEQNGQYSAVFPDFDSCYTSGNSLAEAIEMAEDVLVLTLYDMEEDNQPIPKASNIDTVKSDGIVSLVACDTIEYRKLYDNKAVKKTLTIPNWLNTEAEKRDINFSSVLKEALMEKIKVC
ncbi:MAG: type II toxin-antitoxin system HicB family antitoxin [Lachnospiraceae bacterium]|nr:type II toxin-antitoxin system HicB family antitoxin [Lachnospiraceae bacterium]